MASKLVCSSFTKFRIIIILSFLCSLSFADDSSTVCKSTLYYSYCKEELPNDNSSANVYDYGRYSVRKSLSVGRRFSSLVQTYLRDTSDLSITAIRALEDCRLLSDLNMDFLSSSSKVVNSTSITLPSSQTEDVHTLLSAIITNTQTCMDGLQAADWRLKNGLTGFLSNDTKLYSVSLALFTKGWVRNKKNVRFHPSKGHRAFRNGRLPLKMSRQSRGIFEGVSGRKTDPAKDDDQVLVTNIVIVSKRGRGHYRTINDAVSAAPNNTDGTTGYFLIYITAGVYEEYVSIPKYKKYLMMVGQGINTTVITGNHSVVDGWTTFNSSTFAVNGQGFVAVNITFRNTAGPIKHQAVAVRNDADLSTFYRCSFEGYQDTLYAHSMRQFYRECDIYGTVDFIFGNGAAVLQNCNIYPRLPLEFQFNTITAQGRTDLNQNTGIFIQNCTIRAADDLASSNITIQTYLGRPWKEYSRTIFIQSFMDSLINPLGWHEWSGDFALNTLYYAEFENAGPGSDTTGRVKWPGFRVINATDAANFTVSNFLLGDAWLPKTGIPFTPDLI